jgi:hypothetical protein
MKAHQRVIRERLAETEASEGLFGAYWEGIDRSISNGVVREVSQETAKNLILRYEWLGSMPAFVWHCFGIFYDEVLAGVIVYGPEYSENLGAAAREGGFPTRADWSKYGYEGKMILLSRGACVHWAHPHSASKLIRRSMALLPDKYEVVTATVDETAGEIGTIYQAAGFVYIGAMGKNNAWMIDGQLVGTRVLYDRLGTTRADAVLRAYPGAVQVKQHAKGRYFAFRGSQKHAHRAAIAHRIQPYPKRAVAASSDAADVQSDEGGSQPTLPLHFQDAV